MIHSNKSNLSTLVLLSTTVISIPLLHHQGTFSFGGFIIILFVFITLYIASRKDVLDLSSFSFPASTLPITILLSEILGFTFFDFDPNGIRSLAQFVLRAGYVIAIILTINWCSSILTAKNFREWKIFLLFVIAFIMRLSLTKIVLQPNVDIFDILKHGPRALIQGANPYQPNFGGTLNSPTSSGVTQFITYWPMSLYPFIGTELLGIDPRILLAVIEFLLAFLIYSELKIKRVENEFRVGIPLLFLYFPFFPVVTNRSFIDPLLLLFFYLALRFKRQDRYFVSGIMFGCITATKYLYLPAMIVFASSIKRILRYWKILLASSVTTLVLLLPFILWDYDSFLKQTVFSEMERQGTYLTQFGLGISGFIWTQFGTLEHVKHWMIWGIILYFLLIWRGVFKSIELEYSLTLFILLLVFPRPLGEQYYFLFGTLIIVAAHMLIDLNSTTYSYRTTRSTTKSTNPTASRPPVAAGDRPEAAGPKMHPVPRQS